MSDSFYRAFEEKYRGSRELIKSRLQVYLPFVQPLVYVYPEGKVLDVGCGRGEWLELMGEQGFDALGVDLDDGMLQACRERNLKVETADAVAYMKGLPESSLCVVSGFHIAEHLPFEVLQQLVQQALRVLVPGGLLILETPNPENIAVGTSSFYLDPTHQRPIPPELLSFLPEHYGFFRSKVVRLQEDISLRNKENISLADVISGVSPDYAVVAQKDGGPSIVELFNPSFQQDYGITVGTLTGKYQNSFNARFINIENRLLEAEVKASEAEVKASEAEVKASEAEVKAEVFRYKAEQAEEHAQSSEAAAHINHEQLQAILNSNSWRITSPLRWITIQWRLIFKEGFKQRLKKLLKFIIRASAPFVIKKSKLRRAISKASDQFGFKEKLKSWARPYAHKQLFVDVSSIIEHDHQTGVQRVVKGLLLQLLKHPPEGFSIEPVFATQEFGYRYAKQYKAAMAGAASESGDQHPITYGMGDVFLGLDLNHHLPIIHEKQLHDMQAYGVAVYYVVYDLLPIQFPNFWEAKHGVTQAHKNLLQVISKFTGAVCISQSVATELSSWLKINRIQKTPPFKIRHFHLGADFKQAQTDFGVALANEEFTFETANEPIFIMVGTVEPRKGHAQVLDAFELLWSKGIGANLLIIGKQGWLVDELANRMRCHAQVNKKLIWLERVNDNQLEYAYSASASLIAASYGEGFGLPLIEAAQHKLPIIARDIPVFREVAGSYAYYFNANSPLELAQCIEKWLERYSRGEHPTSDNMPWLNWQQSTEQLLTALDIQFSNTH